MVVVHASQSGSIMGAMDDDPALRESGDLKSTLLQRKHQQHDAIKPSRFASSDVSEATTASESDDEQQQSTVVAAKAKLKALLKKHDRSAKHPEVAKAIEELAALNPTDDAVHAPYLEGRFVSLTRPEFPGRLKQPDGGADVDQYTLGRLSFNIFQPNDLVCTILRTENELIHIPPDGDNDEEDQQRNCRYAYPLITHMIIHTSQGDFPATICMDAKCTSSSSSDKNENQPKNRLGVTFEGGTLTPGMEVRSDPAKLAAWQQVFADAYKKADEQRSYLASLMQYVFKWLFQLTTPTDEDAERSESHSVSFQMKRCPQGYIDILYIDEDLRISKGNRGTVVIVERTN